MFVKVLTPILLLRYFTIKRAFVSHWKRTNYTRNSVFNTFLSIYVCGTQYVQQYSTVIFITSICPIFILFLIFLTTKNSFLLQNILKKNLSIFIFFAINSNVALQLFSARQLYWWNYKRKITKEKIKKYINRVHDEM